MLMLTGEGNAGDPRLSDGVFHSSRIICAKILGNMFSTAHHYANVIMLNWYTLGGIIANKMHRIAIFTLAPKKCGFILYKRTLVSRVHRVP